VARFDGLTPPAPPGSGGLRALRARLGWTRRARAAALPEGIRRHGPSLPRRDHLAGVPRDPAARANARARSARDPVSARRAREQPLGARCLSPRVRPAQAVVRRLPGISLEALGRRRHPPASTAASTSGTARRQPAHTRPGWWACSLPSQTPARRAFRWSEVYAATRSCAIHKRRPPTEQMAGGESNSQSSRPLRSIRNMNLFSPWARERSHLRVRHRPIASRRERETGQAGPTALPLRAKGSTASNDRSTEATLSTQSPALEVLS